jgi:prephenate dehydrogenase
MSDVSAPTGDAHGRRAQLVGTGLIGGSIGLALRARGWHVTGRDQDQRSAERALELGALDALGDDPDAELTVVATPVGAIAAEVRAALEHTTGLVTDVGSVKGPLVPLMADPRYVGGHPMAGSEQEGVDGARADLFEGATWVLTPVSTTDDQALARIRSIVSSLGAEAVSIPPDRHDEMVAIVSHVPHLTAATLMRLADERSAEHRSLLRLAAGGFRDMTRIAAGHPGIWPDICDENRAAILTELDRLTEALDRVRDVVAARDRDGLVDLLEQARSARTALPARFGRPDELVEVRVPIPDRKGELARIFTRATELDVSVADVEIAHSAESQEGVLILLVEAGLCDRLVAGLHADGYHPSQHPLP